MKVCVLGLGEVGLPTVKYIANKGLTVMGYDIKQEAVDRAVAQSLKASSNWHEIPASDVYIICVYAGLKGSDPDFSSIFDVCKKINEKSLSRSKPKTCLVSIESTIVPGLSRKVYEEIFRRAVRLVHVPHRFWAGNTAKHGVRQQRVIGGIDNESLKAGFNFYSKLLGVPLHKVSPIEIAEMSKIAENTYRYIQIAFAEELKMVCEKLGMDFSEVRDACNSKWNIEIPEARDGIGGHCLPKDSRFFASLAEVTQLINGALLVDEAYRKHMQKNR